MKNESIPAINNEKKASKINVFKQKLIKSKQKNSKIVWQQKIVEDKQNIDSSNFDDLVNVSQSSLLDMEPTLK